MLACILLSILCGFLIGNRPNAQMVDFKIVYYGARCLLYHHDVYNSAEFERFYLAEGGVLPDDPFRRQVFRYTVFLCINLPTALFFVVPLALLPWKLAYVLWRILLAASLTVAGFLMGRVAERYAPLPALLLVCAVLANTVFLFLQGNAAGIAVSLCVIAAWCFVEERFEWAGALCMAVSLVLKPQDAGLVWLYFLLARGKPRKLALQTLVVATVLAVPAVLWVSHIAPDWAGELRFNLLTGSAHGGINNPGLVGVVQSPDMIVNLQSIISIFRDEPRFYNAVSYIVCGLLLLAGAIRTLRVPFTRENAWLALAAISALTMLPVYHRLYDAKLLLLMIPACAMLWAEGGRLKWPAALLTAAAIVVTADIPSMLFTMTADSPPLASGLPETIATLALRRPFAFALLAAGIFYLWAYLKSDRLFPVPVESSLPVDAPALDADAEEA